MSRPPDGDRALTVAERQAKLRAKRGQKLERWRTALELIQAATTIEEARKIAAIAIAD